MIRLLQGDCRDVLRSLPDASIHCCVTSPPYFGLRDYGVDGQIGLEASPDVFITEMVAVFREVRRVLRDDATLWLNLGDSYAVQGGKGAQGSTSQRLGRKNVISQEHPWNRTPPDGLKAKDLMMIPARVAIALQADGWYLRSDIIWAKKNCMPESVTDRPSSAHEHVFLLTKSGDSQFWTHRDLPGTRREPAPDYRWVNKKTREEVSVGPCDTEAWRRINLWRGHDYYYDAEAIREEGVIPAGTRAAKGSNVRGELKDVNGRPPEYWNYTGTRNSRNVWSIATKPFSEWQDSIALVPVPISEVPELGASDSALGDDMARITSPDCSLHADLPDLLPKGFCDGLSTDQLSHIRGNARHLAPHKPPGFGSTQPIPSRAPPHPSRSDYSHLGDSGTAKPNSRGTHKTGPDPASCSHATLFEKKTSDTPHTPPSESRPALICRGTDESKTEADMSVSSSEPQTETRNVCRPALESSVSCRCGYYRKVVNKTSHFATFPPELAERCIKAGTSEKGCCAECGTPWARQVERKTALASGSGQSGRKPAGKGAGADQTESGSYDIRMGPVISSMTTGWAAACQCDGPVVPCTVLDPFSGAGTTALVADRLGRHAIGIELNEEYQAIARRRVAKDAGMFAEIGP